MEIHQAFRFELDPSDRQRTSLSRAAGLSRFVWNWGLAARKADYETRVKPARASGEKVHSITTFDQINAWNKAKAEIAPWSSEFSTRIPEHALAAANDAYQSWWRGLKAGRHVGPPRFKTRGKCRESFMLHGLLGVDPTGVTLPRLGRLRVKGSTGRLAKAQARILYATVSRTADRWFVSLTVERQIAEPIAPAGEPVGIDIGLSQSIVLSTGEVIQSPRPLKSALAQLRRTQRAVARSQRSSARRKVKVAKVARIHARVANVRSNWLHKVSDRLTGEHQAIGHEHLGLAGLSRKKKGYRQGRAWADLGAGELFRQLGYKAAWRGVIVVVAAWNFPSSQLCFNCKERNQNLTLKDRLFACPSCGFRIDRDLNAALNLRPVAVMPTECVRLLRNTDETLNARGGNVSPRSTGGGNTALPTWQIPLNREPSTEMAALAAT
jgi:putative transposase